MNQINLIEPYLENGVWKFDDESKNLIKEPFVAGVPEIIQHHVYPKNKFKLFFSKTAFPYWNLKLRRLREEFGGYWYRDHLHTGKEGWLCPALFKYFDKAPPTIYCKIDLD